MQMNKIYLLILLVILGVIGFFGYRYIQMNDSLKKAPTQNQRVEETEAKKEINIEESVMEKQEEGIKTSDNEIDKELDNLDRELDLELEEIAE